MCCDTPNGVGALLLGALSPAEAPAPLQVLLMVVLREAEAVKRLHLRRHEPLEPGRRVAVQGAATYNAAPSLRQLDATGGKDAHPKLVVEPLDRGLRRGLLLRVDRIDPRPVLRAHVAALDGSHPTSVRPCDDTE